MIISENKYLANSIEKELTAVGFSCGFGMSDLDKDSIVIYDVSTDTSFPKIENSLIYIFPSDAEINISGEHTIFIKPFLMSDLVKAFMGVKYGTYTIHKKEETFSISVSDSFLIVCGRRVDLTKNEMIIFNALWENRGTVVLREHLDEITKANSSGNMVAVYINRLREKLSKITEKKVIVTIRDKGYTIPSF